MKWIYLAGAILLEVSATLSLRGMLAQPAWLVVVVVGYVGSFVGLALVLRAGMPVGVAYGVWSACGVVLTAVAATVLFGDPLTWLMGLGIAVVIGGVLLVEVGSQRAQERSPADRAGDGAR